MNPLFGYGAPVAFARVAREHRAALVPLGLVLAVNVAVLVALVLPLSRRVSSNESRAEAATRQQAIAAAEFKQAEAMRDGKAKASTDLETFYTKVLPTSVATARRMTHVKFQQRAREHNVQFQRGATTEEQGRGSALRRLTVAMTLSGEYDDIRAFLYELETSEDFVIIDNVVLTEGGDTDEPLSVALEVSTYFYAGVADAAEAGVNGR